MQKSFQNECLKYAALMQGMRQLRICAMMNRLHDMGLNRLRSTYEQSKTIYLQQGFVGETVLQFFLQFRQRQ